ncbi:hypothetical protein DL93DRAFT_2234272 [Clavulina sp. PMI_390]|nr:hypothetical protein DL93DRAFT_2234272 [Clavulina sp. PMI_390]
MMHQALTVASIFAEILSFVSIEDLPSVGLSCKELFPAVAEAYQRRIERLGTLISTLLPSDVIEHDCVGQLATWSIPMEDNGHREDIIPLELCAILPSSLTVDSVNNVFLPNHVESLSLNPTSGSTKESVKRGQRHRKKNKFSRKLVWRQYVKIFQRLPTAEEVYRLYERMQRMVHLRYGIEDQKALIVFIALLRLFPQYDFFSTLHKLTLELPSVKTNIWRPELLITRAAALQVQFYPPLRSLELPHTPDMSTWRFLSLIPSLGDLKIGIGSNGSLRWKEWVISNSNCLRHPSEKRPPIIVMSNLQHLTFCQSAVCSGMIEVFARVRFPSLFQLTIRNPAKESDLKCLDAVLKQTGFQMPNLQHLTVDMGAADSLVYKKTSPYSIFATAEALKALFAKNPRLEYFHVECSAESCIPALKNSEIVTIAASALNLTHFYQDPLRSPFSHLTLDGLIPFARYCPNLWSLGIGLSIKSVQFAYAKEIYATELENGPASKVEELNVGAPWVLDSAAIASALRAIFPAVHLVQLPDEKCYEVDMAAGHCFGWSKVVKHVKTLSENKTSPETSAEGGSNMLLERLTIDESDYQNARVYTREEMQDDSE